MEILTHPERLDQMLPWGKIIQENYFIPLLFRCLR